jgi:hypothetical protein
MVAFPKAVVLGVASRTLRTGAFIERGFELLSQSADAVRHDLNRAAHDLQQAGRDVQAAGQEMATGTSRVIGVD